MQGVGIRLELAQMRPESAGMITFQRVTKFVRNDIANQFARQEQQFAVQAHATVCSGSGG